MLHSRFRLDTPALVAGLAVILLLLGAPVWAQSPSIHDPESILAWLKMQGIGVSLVLTILWKYLPVVKDWSNKLIPWLTLLGWVAAQVAGVPQAQAAALGPLLAKPSFAQAAAIAVVNSAIAKALWDGWLKPSIGSWLDKKLLRVPQTP